jgi:hypothetical protein
MIPQIAQMLGRMLWGDLTLAALLALGWIGRKIQEADERKDRIRGEIFQMLLANSLRTLELARRPQYRQHYQDKEKRPAAEGIGAGQVEQHTT